MSDLHGDGYAVIHQVHINNFQKDEAALLGQGLNLKLTVIDQSLASAFSSCKVKLTVRK